MDHAPTCPEASLRDEVARWLEQTALGLRWWESLCGELPGERIGLSVQGRGELLVWVASALQCEALAWIGLALMSPEATSPAALMTLLERPLLAPADDEPPLPWWSEPTPPWLGHLIAACVERPGPKRVARLRQRLTPSLLGQVMTMVELLRQAHLSALLLPKAPPQALIAHGQPMIQALTDPASWPRAFARYTIPAQVELPSSQEPHELSRELYGLMAQDTALFDFLQHTSINGLWYCDLIRPDEAWANPSYRRMVGYQGPRTSLDRAWWRERVHPEDLPKMRDATLRHIQDPSVPLEVMLRMLHLDGHLLWVRCRGLVLRDDQGQPQRMLMIMDDLTELKDAQDQALHSAALERSNQELEQFAYVASHDLQEPLRMVASYTELLAQRYRGQLDERADRYIEHAVSGAKRMQQLINDLLAYASLNAPSLQPRQVRLDDVVRQALATLHGAILASQAQLSRPEQLPVVVGHASLLTQLMQNLLSNALKFTQPDQPPQITISVVCAQGLAHVSVSDRGIGIDPQFHERIFQAFQRLHARERYPGTGIGLAMCQKIAALHGHPLKVQSALGQGATFTVTLPLASLRPSATDAQDPIATQGASHV